MPERARSRMISCKSFTVSGSIPEKGSSSRIKCGWSVRDRAISSRRRSPPDKVYALLVRTVSRPICTSSSSSRSRCCSGVSGKVSSTANKFCSLVNCRKTEGSWGLPQEPSVFRQLTSEQNLLAVLETLPLTPEQQRDRLEELLVQMGLETVRTSKAYTLSGGERRRLEIARSLTLQPSFILLDEPFSGIDPLTVKDLQEIIRGLARSGIGILITDHNVRETLNVTDRAYIVNHGKIMAKGTPLALSNDAEVRRVYLGDHFRLN